MQLDRIEPGAVQSIISRTVSDEPGRLWESRGEKVGTVASRLEGGGIVWETKVIRKGPERRGNIPLLHVYSIAPDLASRVPIRGLSG